MRAATARCGGAGPVRDADAVSEREDLLERELGSGGHGAAEDPAAVHSERERRANDSTAAPQVQTHCRPVPARTRCIDPLGLHPSVRAVE